MHPWGGDLESCRRGLHHFTTKCLRDPVDVYLVAWDDARERGDGEAVARGEAQWNAIGDEIDRCEAIASEVAT